MRRIAPLIPLLFLIGCADKLDKDQSRVRQDFGKTCAIFGEAARQREAAISTFANQSFATSKAMIEKDWTSWIETHTDAQGCLVSKHADGSIGPMPVVQLVQAMTARSDKLMQLAMAQANWQAKQADYISAINQFISTAAKLTQKEIDVQDAKESAQATFDKVLSAIGGIAAGAGFGALAL